MSLTANTEPPRKPQPQRGSALSWIFFLLILARPLWGIVRSMVGPQISDSQLWLLVGGALALLAVVLLVRTIAGLRDAPAGRLPPRPSPPTPSRPNAPVPAPAPVAGMPRSPQFEPMFTGKVLLAGILLALAMAGLLMLFWLV